MAASHAQQPPTETMHPDCMLPPPSVPRANLQLCTQLEGCQQKALQLLQG